mmetsp:Transcript_16750/g.25314  ORF Transcript_16750/g.25314 Transcript_16750/m.25314 type:complete len:103 (-) Transcript_16750:195-503(-)
MAIMTTSTQALNKSSFSKVGSKPKYNVKIQNNAQIQPCSKRRRYQRRGSKVPSMFMADESASSSQNLNGSKMELLEMQQKLRLEISSLYRSYELNTQIQKLC